MIFGVFFLRIRVSMLLCLLAGVVVAVFLAVVGVWWCWLCCCCCFFRSARWMPCPLVAFCLVVGSINTATRLLKGNPGTVTGTVFGSPRVVLYAVPPICFFLTVASSRPMCCHGIVFYHEEAVASFPFLLLAASRSTETCYSR